MSCGGAAAVTKSAQGCPEKARWSGAVSGIFRIGTSQRLAARARGLGLGRLLWSGIRVFLLVSLCCMVALDILVVCASWCSHPSSLCPFKALHHSGLDIEPVVVSVVAA